MTSEMAQDALDDALATSAATYEISKRRDALILSVKEGHSVIALLDEIFVQAKLDFVPNIQRSPSNATPCLLYTSCTPPVIFFKIGYAVIPKLRWVFAVPPGLIAMG